MIFEELLNSVFETLQTIIDEAGEAAIRANELLGAISKFEYDLALRVIDSFSALLLPLPIELQTKELDIFSAQDLIQGV